MPALDDHDYFQSAFATERHKQFELEVEKDRLAKLAATRSQHHGPGAVRRRIAALAHTFVSRVGQVRPAGDVRIGKRPAFALAERRPHIPIAVARWLRGAP